MHPSLENLAISFTCKQTEHHILKLQQITLHSKESNHSSSAVIKLHIKLDTLHSSVITNQYKIPKELLLVA